MMCDQIAQIAALAVALCLSTAAHAHNNGSAMTHARGTFEVKIAPLPLENNADDKSLGRSSIDKQWKGDLEGTSKAQMLTALTGTKGSAGYVAIEKVTGTLGGRSGTFVLQHSGSMARGEQQLVITVVPDSGTGGLTGLTGKMAITISEGKHSYDLEYSLAAAR